MILKVIWMAIIIVNMALAVTRKEWKLLAAWSVAALALSLWF